MRTGILSLEDTFPKSDSHESGRSPTSTLAAGLSTYRDLRMVAPSFVTITSWPLPMLCKILSYKHRRRKCVTMNTKGKASPCSFVHLSHGRDREGMQYSPCLLALAWSLQGLLWPWPL